MRQLSSRVRKGLILSFSILALLFFNVASSEDTIQKTGKTSNIVQGTSTSQLILLDSKDSANDASLERKLSGSSGKVMVSDMLRKLKQGGKYLDIIVLLKGYRDYTGKTFTDSEKLVAKQKIIQSQQDIIITNIDTSHFRLKHKFENIMGFSGRVDATGLNSLLAMPEVELIEEDTKVYPHLAQGIPLMNASSYRSTYSGAGLAIAVVDTGIDYTHPMLGGAGFPNSKVIGGYDFGDNDADPMDCQGHGTSVAGITSGSPAAGPGDYIGGVAPNAGLYALKIVAGCSGSSSSSTIAAAWDWAVSHKNDDLSNPIIVINTSFGGGKYLSACDGSQATLAAAANNAVANGITIFASSGNDGYTNGISSPACVSNVISVGAVYDANVGYHGYSSCTDSTTYADKVTCYSNSANFLDILAPSHDAYTTAVGNSYTSQFGGTSAASPYATGAAAVLQNYRKSTTGSYYSPVDLKTILINNGDPITDIRNNIIKPRVNVGNAIEGEDTLAPAPDPMTWSTQPYAASSTSISMVATTATDSSTPINYFFDYTDSPTGGTGGTDSSWQSSTSYTDTGLQPNHRYGYQVKARDSAAIPNETSPSTPTVYKYTLANAPGSAAFSNITRTSIQTNWTANSNRTGTEYYCENTTKNTNSGWTTNLYWNETGLTCGTPYTYRVKARNGDLIETGWTSLGSQSTQTCPDTTPPAPDPMTWSTQPYAASSTSISMVATPATDSSTPINYFFDYTDSPTGGTGGTDSSWQSSTSYTDTGLQPNHRYGYQVKARDSAAIPNETSPSTPTVYKYTLANAPGSAAFSNITRTSIQTNWTANSNRTGTEYYCENTTKNTNSGWTTNLYWNETGLTCGTPYTYRVKARNGDLIETGWTSLGSQSTQTCPVSRTEIGIFRNGIWYLDYNGNGVWDGCGTTPDTDRCYYFGIDSDQPVVGDWNGTGTSKIGLFRNGTWYLDYNGNGVWDGCGATPDKDRCIYFGEAGDKPYVGDWNGSGTSKIGFFRNGVYYFDYNGNGQWNGCGTTPDTDRCIYFGIASDTPFIGDWGGTGISKFGLFRNGVWYADYNGNGVWEGCDIDRCYYFGLASDTPITGDWDGTGFDKIGLFRSGIWYLDYNGSGGWESFDIDRSYENFAVSGGKPIAGHW